MQKIIKALVALGLSDKEANVYISLYRLGKSTAYQVAKEAGMKRPTVYVLMEELRKKGLAIIVPHEKNHMFIAKNPKEFMYEYQIEQQKYMQDIITSLPTLTRSKTQTEIISFKGEGTLAQGLLYGLHNIKDKHIYAFYAGVPKRAKVHRAYIEHKRLIHQLGFKLQCVIPEDSDDSMFKKGDVEYGFQIRKIKSHMFSPQVSVEICGDMVKFIFHAKREVIIFEEKSLADVYRQLFTMIWVK